MTAVLPSSTSVIALSSHPPKGNQKKNKMKAAPLEVLSLFFAQAQTFEERFGLASNETERRQDDETKEEKGKEKMTEEEEAALAAEEEEESGEEGLIAESINEDLSIDEGEFDDDEAYYFERFEVEDCFDDGQEPVHEELDCDMTEDKGDVELEELSEWWERRVVSPKLGGHLVRRHSRAHKKPRLRPYRWVNAREERKRCERQGLVFGQAMAHKGNATQGLVYRTIDYYAIRQEVILPSTSPSSTTSTPSASTTTTSHTRTRSHNHGNSSSSSDGRVPFYERELTQAINRGGAVQCGLTAQQLNDLLNRELTPEDYEMLLMLDSTVKPKTLSSNLIDSFPSRTLDAGSPLVNAGERCAICMCSFEAGEGVKELPRCQHSFHTECIVQWLSTASTKCPLCSCSLE